MSYFIKYKLSFVSDRGNVYDLHILQKNYAGQPIVKKLGVAPVLSIEDGEGRVKGSSLSFAVQADVEGELKGLYTTNNKEFKVLLYRNSSLYWQGFVLPELYSENYIDPPYDVAVTASDQLGVLKNVEYQQEAGYKSLLEIIAYTLSITHLDLKIVQHLNLTLAGKERFLDGAYVATEGYYGQSCYDVLNSVLLSCNACIQQYGNEWVIMSLTDVSTSYNKDGVNIEIPHVQLGQMGSAQVYPDGSLEMVNKPAVKGVTLNYAHVLKNSFLKNADCQSKDGWQYSFEPLDNRLPGTVDAFGVIYKCNCWQLPQKDVTVSGELQLWQDVNVKADNTYNCQLSVDYRMDLGASLLLMAIIHEGVDGITRRLTSEGWKEGVSDTDRNSYINVTGTPSELWLTWAKDIADFSKYEKTTVQFRLPDVDGVLRIGFINTSETSYVNPLSGYVYITKVYLTYMGITGKASTTVVEEDATNAQEEISLAYGERVPATNEALAVLNTLRSASGVPREQFSLNNTSGVKSYDSYFLAMLQEMSRYYAVKKMHLQGVVMGVSPLHLLYKDVFSGKVMRLVSGEYDLLQDTLGVLLEEVPDAWVDYEPEVYATDNSVPGVSSSGVVTVGGGGGTSLLAVNAKGEVYVKDERVLSGAEADFGKVVLPAEKPEKSSDKVYIYSQVPAADEQLDNKAVNVHLMVDELVELRDDFDALNDLLNSDVAGVINTWDEIVDFLNEYGESQDLASILSQMNTDIANRVLYTDFEKLEDAVDGIAGYFTNGSANNALKLGGQLPSYYATVDALNTVKNDVTAVSNRVQKFEDVIGIDANGDVYIKGTCNFYTAGGTIGMAGLGSGGSGGGGAAGIVTIRVNGEDYSSVNGIVTLPDYPSLAGYATEDYVTSRGYITGITSAMVTTALGYIPYNSSNPSGYITASALNGYAKLADIPTSLPASDVYSWAKAATKPTYTASEVGALSEGGGIVRGVITLSGNAVTNVPLNIATPSMGYTGYIRFGAGFDTNELGHLGFSAKGVPAMRYEGVVNTLYHTGNFNPNDYLPLSGGTLNGSLGISSSTKPTGNIGFWSASDIGFIMAKSSLQFYKANTQEYFNIIHSGNIGDYAFIPRTQIVSNTNADTLLNGVYLNATGNGTGNSNFPNLYSVFMTFAQSSNYVAQFAIGNGSAYVRRKIDTWSDWKSIAFTDSDITGNAASATKLQTARSIWGQSFDGSGNINGHLYLENNYSVFAKNTDGVHKQIIVLDNGNSLVLGFGTSTAGYNTYLEGNELNFRYGVSHSLGMKLTVNGNVLIGTTKDNGAKLQVDGAIDTTAEVKIGGLDVLRRRDTKFCVGEETTVYASQPTSIYGTSISFLTSYADERMRVADNGNVLIGTTTDNGGKLQLDGNINIKGQNQKIELTNGMSIGRAAVIIETYESSYANIQTSLYGVDYICPLTLNPRGGNVLIGATTDNGAKLQVNGDATAKVLVANKNGDGGAGAGLSLYCSKDFVNTYGIHMSKTSAYGTKGDVTGDWATYFSMRDVSYGGWIFRGLYGNVVAISNTSGNLTVTGGATFGGDVYSEGTIAMARLASSSDRKLKENIKWLSAEKSMEVVRALRPTEWNWKKDGTHSFGFIAQDVQPIVPEMVSSVNDTLRLEYNQLHSFEIGAIQHIDGEVETLKKDLKTANNRIEVLEKELNEYRRTAQWQ